MKLYLTKWEVVWYTSFLALSVWLWLALDRPGLLWGGLIGVLFWSSLSRSQNMREFKRRQARRGRRAKLKAKRSKSKWEVFHSPRSRS